MADTLARVQFERRALQALLAVVAIVPVLAGSSGALLGVDILHIQNASISAESHFRYLSGLLLAIGLFYWSCVPRIEQHGERIKLLTTIVFIGGVARALDLYFNGIPSPVHIGALVIELAIAPAVMFWQHRVATRVAAT